MHINAVTKNVVLQLLSWPDFQNTILKYNVNYTKPQGQPHPPQIAKFWVRF
jgi:hypothetical protein